MTTLIAVYAPGDRYSIHAYDGEGAYGEAIVVVDQLAWVVLRDAGAFGIAEGE